MGSKPKPQQYQPSETEKIQAAVAQADARFFERNYDSLLKDMRDEAKSNEVSRIARTRAGADSMQALTGGGLDYGNISGVDTSANIASGAISNLLSANVTAKNIQNKAKSNVIGTARGQAADAGSGLAQASKLARSEGLSAASNRLSRSQNIMGNISKLGQAGIRRYKQKGDLFFMGKNTDSNKEVGTEFTPQPGGYFS